MQQSEPSRAGPNLAMLRWARDDAGLSLDEAARRLRLRKSKLGSPGERLALYESGAQSVPSDLVHRMCGVYRQPWINFFTSEPPLPDDYGHDFRTCPKPTTPEEEGALRAIQSDLFLRQSVVRDCLEESEDHSPLQFVGSLTRREGIDAAISHLHRLLETEQRGAPCHQVGSPRQLYRELRSRIERLGVFVLIANDARDRYLKLSSNAFSGIAIADALAPFVVINGDDPALSPAFVLVHQFVHVLLGTTGVCNAPSTIGTTTGACETETFCREVAAGFLVPSELVVYTAGGPAHDKVAAARLAEMSALAKKPHVHKAHTWRQLLRPNLGHDTTLGHQSKPPSWKRAGTSGRVHGRPPTNQASNTRATVERRRAQRLAAQKERLGEPLIQLIRALVGEQAITYNTAGLALGTTAGMAASLLHDNCT